MLGTQKVSSISLILLFSHGMLSESIKSSMSDKSCRMCFPVGSLVMVSTENHLPVILHSQGHLHPLL